MVGATGLLVVPDNAALPPDIRDLTTDLGLKPD